MSYGLRVWDASGALQLEVVDRIPKFEAIYTVPSLSSRNSTTIYHPGFALGQYYFATNMKWTVRAIPGSGSITFNKWYYDSSEQTSPSFIVCIFKA